MTQQVTIITVCGTALEMSFKVQQTFHQKQQKRENILNSIFINMSMCCGANPR